MSNIKGLAIRLDKKILKKIEKQDLPENDLIQKAVIQYLENNETKQEYSEENIPDEIYEEVYNTLYNIEMVPLKQKIEHQLETINILKEQLCESKNDKQFLQNQILQMQLEQKKIKVSLRTRIKRKFLKKQDNSD